MSYTRRIFDYFLLTIAVFVVALGHEMFLVPIKINSGGLLGVAIVIYHLFLSSYFSSDNIIPIIFLAINIPLFYFIFKLWGKGVTFKTLYGSIALPLLMMAIGKVRGEALISNFYVSFAIGIILVGIGVGASLSLGGSTGGVDVLALISIKFFPSIKMGIAIGIFRLLILLLFLLAFSVKHFVFSILSAILIGLIVQFTISLLGYSSDN